MTLQKYLSGLPDNIRIYAKNGQTNLKMLNGITEHMYVLPEIEIADTRKVIYVTMWFG